MFSSIWSADSGDIVAAIFNHGSIHPPGYPLYYLLGRLFSFLPWFSPAGRVAIVSLIFSLLTIVFTSKLLLFISEKKDYLLKMVSLALIFVGQLWLIYSLVPEVFTMTTFFLMASLYYLVRFYKKQNESDHLKFWFFFAWGVTHQYLLLLTVFVYAFVLWKSRYPIKAGLRNNFIKIFAIAVSALLPYLFFYLLWDKNAIVRWEPKNLVGVFDLMTRRSYGFFATTTGSYQDLWGKVGNVLFYLQSLAANYSIVIFVIILSGLWRMIGQKNKLNWLVFLALLLYGPAFIFYIDAILRLPMGRGVLERFVIISFPLLAIVVYNGLVQCRIVLFAITKRWFKTKSGKDLLLGAYSILVLLFFVALTFKNLLFINELRDNQVFDLHAQNLLESLPKNSIVILNGDLDLFPAQYWRYAKQERSDIALLSGTKMGKEDYFDTIKANFPKLNIQTKTAGSTIEFIRLNFRHFPMYTNYSFDTEYFGFERQGLLFRVVNKKVAKKPYFPVKLSNRVWDEMGHYREKVQFFAALKEKYGKALYEVASTYFRRKDFLLANAYFYEAYRFIPENNTMVEDYALSLLKTNNCREAQEILLKSFTDNQNKQAAFYLSRLSAVCYKDKAKYLYWDAVYRKK